MDLKTLIDKLQDLRNSLEYQEAESTILCSPVVIGWDGEHDSHMQATITADGVVQIKAVESLV